LKRIGKIYRTGPWRYRDYTKQYELFKDYFRNEAPFGFDESPIFGIDGILIM